MTADEAKTLRAQAEEALANAATPPGTAAHALYLLRAPRDAHQMASAVLRLLAEMEASDAMIRDLRQDSEAYQRGLRDGFDDGWKNGWNAACNVADPDPIRT